MEAFGLLFNASSVYSFQWYEGNRSGKRLLYCELYYTVYCKCSLYVSVAVMVHLEEKGTLPVHVQYIRENLSDTVIG